ncbi:flagellar basal body rod protein FlgC [bacterium]|nr:flagellar basal body rod protein FlgC [bacterium]MCP5463100.1 flagellar basal body rod protein FlgC [bacterium]
MFSSLDISASGLSAEQTRMSVIANNLANAHTTSPDGMPYKRKLVLFSEVLDETIENSSMPFGGVGIDKIVESKTPYEMVYDPSHPHADTDGYVQYPNVNPVEEMVDMITASRAYEANIAAFNAAKTMMSKALELGQ